MKIGVLGTGVVGQTLATKLVELGHQVMMGSRRAGNEKAWEWAATTGRRAHEGTFADAARFGKLLFNCTAGAASLGVLRSVNPKDLSGKILVDVANPLDYSRGTPPGLFVSNDDSLGEQIQRAFPETRVVKALNTVNAELMVDPGKVPGDHDVFIAGNDAAAKDQVRKLIGDFGWPVERIIDLGDITAARATEMYLALWIRLMGKLETGIFNIEIVR
jgi:predicted dinucleotide-binding enzyme